MVDANYHKPFCNKCGAYTQFQVVSGTEVYGGAQGTAVRSHVTYSKRCSICGGEMWSQADVDQDKKERRDRTQTRILVFGLLSICCFPFSIVTVIMAATSRPLDTRAKVGVGAAMFSIVLSVVAFAASSFIRGTFSHRQETESHQPTPNTKLEGLRSGSGVHSVVRTAGSASKQSSSANPIIVTGDPDAASVVKAELEKTWLETPDGWISEYTDPLFAQDSGKPLAVGSVFHQFKELKFEVTTDQLTAIGKERYEFKGMCHLTSFSSRYYFRAPDGSNGTGKWTEWSATDPVTVFGVTKEHGVWFMSGGYDHNLSSILKSNASDLYIWSGRQPEASTLASLK